jgi:hypothetical protein
MDEILFNEDLKSFLIYFKEQHSKKNRIKYKYKINNKNASYSVSDAYNKYIIETPSSSYYQEYNHGHLIDNIEKPIKMYIEKNYEIFYPLIRSISFKYVIEMNKKFEITSKYYKVCFFSKMKTFVIRIHNNEMASFFTNQDQFFNSYDTKHIIMKNLYNVDLDNDFIFDIKGIEVLKMMII